MKIFSLSPVLLAGVAAAIITTACAGNMSGTGAMSDFQGLWVDVNGESRIEFTGDKMKFGYGDDFKYSETYDVKLKKDDDDIAIVNADSEYYDYYSDYPGFGVMSYLTYDKEEGVLSAQEMILDGRGHNYRFVRENQLAKELEIKDLSTDAPKTIESKNINNFSLSFYYCGQDYGLGDKWKFGSYGWQIIKDSSGKYKMDFSVMGDSYVIMQYNGEVGEEYVRGLAQLLEDKGIIQYNGYYMENSRDGSHYSLYAVYDSRERLSVRANGDAADKCVFDMALLLDYAALQIPENNFE